MSQLMNLQQIFQSYLMTDDLNIASHIVATEKVPVMQRLEIYGYAYRSRLIDALASNFPLLKLYLGDDEFDKLGNLYLEQYPSTFRSIRWFGSELPSLIATHYQQDLYLVEFAQLEWILTLVFDAADAEPVTLEVMSQIAPDAWGEMRLHFHPSLHILPLTWDLIPFWKTLAEDQAPEKPATCVKAAWLFWRKELTNQFCPLTAAEEWGIREMQQNANFGQLCEGLCEWFSEEEAVMQAASFLKSWISSGLIVKVVV